MKQSVIYQIQSKIKPERIYIGSTVYFRRRKNQHLTSLRARLHISSKLQRHCDKYGINDLVFSIIEPCLPMGLISREQYYLDTLKPYFNTRKIADSCVGIPCSEEKKEKIRIANKGHKISEEQKQKLRIANLGKKQSPETIRKKILATTGKKRSAETKAKIGAAHKGKVITPEQREKIRKTLLGHKHTEQAKKNMSAARKGHPCKTKRKPMSLEQRAFLSKLHTGNKYSVGRSVSPEYKERLRIQMTGNTFSVGRKLSKEHIAAIMKGNLGKKRPPATSEKMKKAWRIRKEKQIRKTA